MSIKIKIFGIVSISLLLAWSGIAFTGFILVEQNQKLDANFAQTEAVTEHNIPLLIAIKSIKTDVIQVQQWLSDISATRGLPGFDDGFDEAESFAAKFEDDVLKAQRHAQQMDLPEVLSALEELKSAFPPYYDAGRKMAQAYIDLGPEGGNIQMGEFDAVAEVMGRATDTLVAMVEEETNLTLVALSNRSDEINRVNKTLLHWLNFFSAAAAFTTIACLAYLFRYLTRSFHNLNADVQMVMSGELEGKLRLDPDRKDEFGPLAKALAAFRVSLSEGKKQEAMIREAEQTRIQQAEAEVSHALQMEADRQAQREQEQRIIEEISSVVATCADGDFSRRLRTDDKEGILSEICQGINQVGEAANEGLNAIGIALEHLSSGNLSYTMSEEYPGVFSQIAKSMNKTTKSLSHTLTDITASSESVYSATREIAVAVEGISDKAKVGQEVVNSTVAAMGEIETSSIAIGNILHVIDEIAFQTNLLALNARVEAGRAGEAGRGFAIVASEVLALAARSSNAALEIADLVESSGENVKRGVKLARESDDALGTIVAEVREVVVKTDEIGVTMKETATGIEEISTSTIQRDETPHENAAMSDEGDVRLRALP